MAEDWRTWSKRQRIIHQIDEYLRQTPGGNMKSAQELENSLFQKATKEEDYLQYVSKIIKYLKEQAKNTNQNNSNLTAMLGGQQGTGVGNPGMSQAVNNSGQMVHNTQNQMVHTGNAGTQMSHGSTSGGQMTHTGVTGNQSVGTTGMIQNTFVSGPNRMSQLMAGNMNNQGEMVWQGKPRRQNEMIMINVNAKHPGMGNLNQMNPQAGKMGTIPMAIAGQNDQVNQISVGSQIQRQGMAMQPRVPSPSFPVGGGLSHPRQGTPTPSTGSPASQQQPQPQQPQQQQQQQAPPQQAQSQQQQQQQAHQQQQSQQQQQQQQQHSTAHSTLTFISPSPSSNAVPSPAGSTGGRNLNQLGAPSPGGMINTPGQPQQQQQPSPAAGGGSLEDRAYMEKVKQLQSKYLETLRDVAQRFGNSDSENARKIRNLLEVIENPQRRASKGMETLKACEVVLERIGIQQREHRAEAVASSKPASKEDPVRVLFDAINFAQKSPLGTHTIHRTLSPALKTLLGPDFEPHLPKKVKVEEPLTLSPDSSLISDVIQGEVARLPPRFKVNLESQQLMGSDDLTLSCQLDDPNLPCVPPITLIIPATYPNNPPRCSLSEVEYETTTFLKKVREIMANRQCHLPEVCSLTMMLDAWEMSVRRACSSKPFVPDAINPLINLSIFS